MTRKKPPTMADVARLSGVSTMTVSRALRPDASASEEMRTKIRRAADKLGYILDSTAAGLSSRKTGFVAVTIPSINNANFSKTVAGLTEGLRDSGLQVLLSYTGYDLLEEERMVEGLLRRRPEAIVVTGGNHSKRCRRFLAASGVPVVEMWDLPKSPIDHVVGFSNAEAGSIMAHYLYDSGYRKISFIGGNTARDVRGGERRRGFESAMEAFGIKLERQWDTEEPILTMDDGAYAMKELLQRFPDTEAVMCASDLSAFGALMVSAKMGLKVPGDIAIAGIGAYEISGSCYPQITTLDVSAYEIGAKTARVITEALDIEHNSYEPQRIEITTVLLPRESTSKPKAKH